MASRLSPLVGTPVSMQLWLADRRGECNLSHVGLRAVHSVNERKAA